MILSLDLGTTTGWATGDSLSNIQSGVINLRPSKKEPPCIAYLRFSEFLADAPAHISKVLYEKVVRHKGTRAAHVYGAFEGTLELWCLARKIPLVGVGVSVLKKATTGVGNASKEHIQAALELQGFRIADHNEADALALLLYGLAVRH